MTPREQLIADLRAFADLLEARPDMPVGDFPCMKLQHSPMGEEAERLNEVRRIAGVLGVDPIEDGGAVRARLDLGWVEYLVYASTDYRRAASAAGRSYWGSVEPEMVVSR